MDQIIMTDPVDLTRRLIRCASVTPKNDGAIELLEADLTAAGFTCMRADRGGISNLIARWGAKAHPRTFGFNGHTDVVPTGDPAEWTADPFGAEIKRPVRPRHVALWRLGLSPRKSRSTQH